MKQITAFWNCFQKNEQKIISALLLKSTTDEAFHQIIKKLNNISKKISFTIKIPKTSQEKYIIIFSGTGNRRVFPKIIALENQAPSMKQCIAQAFIKPLDLEKYKKGTDQPFLFDNYEIKLSKIKMELLDYNTDTRHLKIKIYLSQYNELRHFDKLTADIHWMVMYMVGEIAYHRHIKEISLHQLPLKDSRLLSLLDLPSCIDYCCKINSGKNTRQI